MGFGQQPVCYQSKRSEINRPEIISGPIVGLTVVLSEGTAAERFEALAAATA